MNICFVIAKQAFPFFNELYQASLQSLTQLGHQVSYREEYPQEGYNYVFAIGPHALPLLKKQVNTRYIAIQTEQLPQINTHNSLTQRNWNHLEQLLKPFDLILDFYQGNLNFLKFKGFQHLGLFEIGYHPSFDFTAKYQTEKEIYDLCLIGHLSARRQQLLDKLKGIYTVCPISFAFGEERTKLLFQSRVCLNVHVENSDFFEKLRIEQLFLANRRFIISESALYTEPYLNNQHLIFRKYEDLEASIQYYLSNLNLRKKIAEQGYQLLKQYPFSKHWQTIILKCTLLK